MTRILDSMFRAVAPAMESGVSGVDVALKATSRLLDRWTGEPGGPRRNGAARSLDEATSELANRMLRTALGTPRAPELLAAAGRETLAAAAGGGALRDPLRLAALPLRLSLSWATLATQEGLRTLAAAQVVPVARLPDFLDFVIEVFSDLDVYFRLRYQEELERLKDRLEREPENARVRLDLGRTYLKCGLFEEAARELRSASRGPEVRRKALYLALVAGCRAGDRAGAVRDGVECLRLDPGHERARFWLFLTARQAGGYPPEVPPELRMEAVDGYHPTPVVLRDVAAEIGLDKTSGGRGTAVADFHGHGRLDVVIAGAHAGCGLYRNDGVDADGRAAFTDVSAGSGLDRCVYGFGTAVGDYDNDGLPDLFVTSLGFFNGCGKLMHNDGDGTFTDVTEKAGLERWGPGFTATWIDYDGDGYLDLFLAYNLGGLFDRKTPNRLFHNNGDGTFTEVTAAAGLETAWPTIGAAWGDFWNDGRPDLFVSGLGRAQLFRNEGDGTFTDVSRDAGVDAPANGSVALACDVDDDGWLDIVHFTYSRPFEAIYTLRHGHGPADGRPLRIFRNNRDGTFTDVAPELGVTGCWGTMSAAVGDFDNDGYQDLFLGNGDPGMDRTEASVLLANDGGGGFRNVSFAAGLPFTGKGHGVNMADLAGDGRLHLIEAAGGLYPGDLMTTAVYRPEERPGNYLNVRLVGTRSNRDAVGARLRLLAGGREQHRLVSGGSFFGCQPYEQHFGLGGGGQVAALEIRWPSGARQRFEDLPVNATLRFTEGEPGWADVYGSRERDGRDRE